MRMVGHRRAQSGIRSYPSVKNVPSPGLDTRLSGSASRAQLLRRLHPICPQTSPLAGLVPAIHVFPCRDVTEKKTWVAGTSPAKGISMVDDRHHLTTEF